MFGRHNAALIRVDERVRNEEWIVAHLLDLGIRQIPRVALLRHTGD